MLALCMLVVSNAIVQLLNLAQVDLCPDVSAGLLGHSVPYR